MTKRLAGLPINLMELRRGPITSDGRFEELRDSLLSSVFEDDMVVWWLEEGCSGVLTTILSIFYGAFTTVLRLAAGGTAVYCEERIIILVLSWSVLCHLFFVVNKILFSSGRGTTICRASPPSLANWVKTCSIKSRACPSERFLVRVELTSSWAGLFALYTLHSHLFAFALN